MARLSDHVDLVYALSEFDAIYRHGSAGGSTAIRSHRKRVRDTLNRIVDGDPPIEHRAPMRHPVLAHFGRAIDIGTDGPLRSMARALDRVSPILTWEYGYETMPRKLAQQYAYAELLGPRGPVVADGLILGVVLFAPRTIYPQHSHKGIEESYISIAGAWSENNVAVYAPGSLILNRSGEEHRITVGDRDPCLLAYAWTGPAERLSDPAMQFSKPQKKI